MDRTTLKAKGAAFVAQQQVMDFFGFHSDPFNHAIKPTDIYVSPAFLQLEKQILAALSREIPIIILEGKKGLGKTSFMTFFADHLKMNHELVHLEQFDQEFLNRLRNGRSVQQNLRDFVTALSTSPRLSQKKLIFLIDDVHEIDFDIVQELLGVFANGMFTDQVCFLCSTRQNLFSPANLKDTSLLSYYTLRPLSLIETERYLFQKLFSAGLVFSNHLFGKKAIALLWRLSHGIPGEINIWTRAMLMYAFENKSRRISDDLVQALVIEYGLAGESLTDRVNRKTRMIKKATSYAHNSRTVPSRILNPLKKFLRLFPHTAHLQLSQV